MAHVHAVGVGEVVPQVGKGTGSTLEMGARNLHALSRQENTCHACTQAKPVDAGRLWKTEEAASSLHTNGWGDKIQLSRA